MGHEAVVKTSQVDEKFGQIEIEKDGAPLVLNARIGDGAEPISKGEKVIGVSRAPEGRNLFRPEKLT